MVLCFKEWHLGQEFHWEWSSSQVALYRNWFLGWEFCTEQLSSPSVVSRNDDCVLSWFCCNDAWQVAMASIKEKFWTLAATLQVVWLREGGAGICRDVNNEFFPLLEKKSMCLAVFFTSWLVPDRVPWLARALYTTIVDWELISAIVSLRC